MNIKFFMSDIFACGHVRAEVPSREINEHHIDRCRIDCKTDILYSDFFGTDIMIFQRQHQQDVLEKMRYAKSRGILTIYEVDDNLLEMPPQFKKPHEFYSKPEVQSVIKQFLNEVDIVTVSTDELGKWVLSIAPQQKVMLIPNSIDASMWEEAYQLKSDGDPLESNVTIGWMASGSHMIDAPLVGKALGKLMSEFDSLRLHFIGWIGFRDFPGVYLGQYTKRIKIDPWIEINELPTVMSDFSIGVAPLKDVAFNNQKSALKYFQYSVLGIPTVASPSLSYVETIDEGCGMIAGSEESWYSSLKELIIDKQKRLDMGEKARNLVLKRYDIRQTAPFIVAAYEKIMKEYKGE